MPSYDSALRDFYAIQADYQPDEDDAAYEARKQAQRNAERDELERVPGYGSF